MPEVAQVLVVGGGPAGLATAIAARQAGLGRVLVLDGRRPPIDKACGEGLMPDGLERLKGLGVPTDRLGGASFRGIRYLEDGAVAEGRFPRGAGLGLRRTALHEALVKRAEEAGVELEWGVKVTGLGTAGRSGEVETDRGPRSARWVVAADGLHSRLRSWAGLERPAAPGLARRRFGVRRHFRLAPWADVVEVYWANGAEAYVTPVASDEVGVALLWSGGTARFDELLARFPALAARLDGALAASRDRGAGPLLQRVRRVTQGQLALVGDASGYVDAITGEGLSLAFHQAQALAEALAAGDLRAYERAHRRIARLPDGMTRLMLAIERRPRLRRRVIRALAAEPALFSRLLAVHTRALPLRGLGLPNVLRLAWRLAGV